jgi:hypothetical protein
MQDNAFIFFQILRGSFHNYHGLIFHLRPIRSAMPIFTDMAWKWRAKIGPEAPGANRDGDRML